jgi:hypothetical protein
MTDSPTAIAREFAPLEARGPGCLEEAAAAADEAAAAAKL